MHRQGQGTCPLRVRVKVSVATTLKRSKGGQFALHDKSAARRSHDGHRLASVIPADAGYRGHNAPQSHKFRVFTSGQKRRVTPAIKRRCGGVRRSSRWPHLRPSTAWAATTSPARRATPPNAIPAAAGYNFSLLLGWVKGFLSLLIALIPPRPKPVAA